MSELYAGARRVREREAWDTIDERLVGSLLKVFPALKQRRIWEPAAGAGRMADQLMAAGADVRCLSDIAPRRDDILPLDVFRMDDAPQGCSAFVTNPPWGRLAAPFVRRVLQLAKPRKAVAAMLLPLPWMASRNVADLTSDAALIGVVVPRYRARWMTATEEAALPNGPSGPKMNHCWMVWHFSGRASLPIVQFVDAPGEERSR